MECFHIKGIQPKRILKIVGKKRLLFQGEYGYIYSINLHTKTMKFIVDNTMILAKDYLTEDVLNSNIDSEICGLALDWALNTNGDIICCSSDGTVHVLEFSNNDWHIKKEIRLSDNRLISIQIDESDLYLLSDRGQIFFLDLVELYSNSINRSLTATWDIDTSGANIYYGCADGRIYVQNREEHKITSIINTRSGWINAIHDGYCCTSGGVLFKNQPNNEWHAFYDSNNQYWFNDFCVFNNHILVATAEGKIITVDTKGIINSVIDVSDNQLISITLFKNCVWTASVKGEIIVCQMIDNKLSAIWKFKIDAFITCIRSSKKRVYVSTISGEIFILNIGNPRNHVIKYMNKMILSQSRIWKISICDDYIYCGSIDGEIFKLCENKNEVFVYKTGCVITTIAIDQHSEVVYYGTRTGEFCMCTSEFWSRTTPTVVSSKITEMEISATRCNKHKVTSLELHINDNISFNGRLIQFLYSMNQEFKIVIHDQNKVPQNVEWWQFPYLTFNNTFLASGMLLDEFAKHHVIERLL